MFGKIGKGNSDPSLTLFDESAAPNHYKLAREFVLFDNFYVNADVSADGHNWATAGIAPDYTQKHVAEQIRAPSPYYGFEGGEPANTPPAGYIWTNALTAGLSVRNYGEFVENKKQAGPDGIQMDHVSDPSLRGITNMRYRGFDLDYPDVERARVFLSDLKEFESSGNMPRLMIVTAGQRSHQRHHSRQAVSALVCSRITITRWDMIVEGVSKSRFWAETAIFVDRRRRAERTGSRRFAPFGDAGDLAVHASRHHRQHDVQPVLHHAHHGVDSGPAAHDAIRRGRPASDRGLRHRLRIRALCRREAADFPHGTKSRGIRTAARSAQDGFRRSRSRSTTMS